MRLQFFSSLYFFFLIGARRFFARQNDPISCRQLFEIWKLYPFYILRIFLPFSFTLSPLSLLSRKMEKFEKHWEGFFSTRTRGECYLLIFMNEIVKLRCEERRERICEYFWDRESPWNVFLLLLLLWLW